jgi:hypothetical protein
VTPTVLPKRSETRDGCWLANPERILGCAALCPVAMPRPAPGKIPPPINARDARITQARRAAGVHAGGDYLAALPSSMRLAAVTRRSLLMDDDRFDTLARALHARSRRRVLGSLTGLALGGALGPLLGLTQAEAKKRKKKKKKKRPTPPPSPPPPPPPPGCGAGPLCGAGQICVQGQCVTGQGTCPTGEDFCTGETGKCGTNCVCWTTRTNETRCGENISLSGCDTCVSDATCAAAFPNVPGVFCVQDTGTNCSCGNFCAAPCCTGEADGTACGSGQICAKGQCVTGQGTCAAGADACHGSSPCNGASSGCQCFTTMAGLTRCGNGTATGCNSGSDAECAARFPNTPGVFSVKDTGNNCLCDGACMAPCAS